MFVQVYANRFIAERIMNNQKWEVQSNFYHSFVIDKNQLERSIYWCPIKMQINFAGTAEWCRKY